MRHLIFAISLLLTFNTATAQYAVVNGKIITTPASEENLIDNKIYFFAHSMCHDCKDAFVYLSTQHPELDIPITDMKFSHNLNLYKQCVKKFNISNKELRLPLFCMGNNYLMGWDYQSGPKFEEILKSFQTSITPTAE